VGSLGLFALLCLTSASQAQPNNGPKQPAAKRDAESDWQSPWDAKREVRICRTANLIVVGTVVDLEYGPPTWRPEVKARNASIMTTASVLVDGVATGLPPSVIEVKYSGGVFPDGSRSWVSDSPNFRLGEQYLLFMTHRSQISSFGADVMIIEQIKLEQPVELPPDSVLNAIWVEHCVPGASLGNRPTQGLLPLLPDLWIRAIEQVCEHY